jgi:hypothetical protein
MRIWHHLFRLRNGGKQASVALLRVTQDLCQDTFTLAPAPMQEGEVLPRSQGESTMSNALSVPDGLTK